MVCTRCLYFFLFMSIFLEYKRKLNKVFIYCHGNDVEVTVDDLFFFNMMRLFLFVFSFFFFELLFRQLHPFKMTQYFLFSSVIENARIQKLFFRMGNDIIQYGFYIHMFMFCSIFSFNDEFL